MKCLVVDTSATTRHILTRTVKLAGPFDVREASSAEAALGNLDGDVDLVIADWGLPDMTIFDFARHVRARFPHSPPALLVVTNRATLPSVDNSVATGIDGYVVKPFAPRDFALALEQVLAARPS